MHSNVPSSTFQSKLAQIIESDKLDLKYTYLVADGACAPVSITFEKIMNHVLPGNQVTLRLDMSPPKNKNTSARSFNVIEDCAKMCRTDPDCTAFYMNPETLVCHVSNADRTAHDLNLNYADRGSNSEDFYFRKTCLKGKDFLNTTHLLILLIQRI